jgi:hypothetical protein
MISGFCCDVDEIFVLLGYYAALSGSSLPTFRAFLLDFLTLEVGTFRLSRNVVTELPFIAVLISQKNADLNYATCFSHYGHHQAKSVQKCTKEGKY